MNNIVGKNCPYCQSPIKPVDDIVYCSDCDIPHHRDCWEEGGCTTFGCHGNPASWKEQQAAGMAHPEEIDVEQEGYYTQNGPHREEVVLQETNHKSKTLIYSLLGLIFFGLIIGAGLYYQNIQQIKQEKADYLSNVSDVVNMMVSSGAAAEGMINEYSKVWRAAINDEYNYYNKLHGQTVYNFDDALSIQYQYFSDNGYIDTVVTSKDGVDLFMKKLKNPPEEYANLYVTLINLYGDYSEFVSLAVDPTGSYNSYTEKTRELSSGIVKRIDKLNIQLPENTE